MSTTTLRAYLDDVAGLLEQQALEEVIGHCRHILQHFPKNLETYRILGQALLEKNRHQEASDVFQRVLGALPDDFKAHIGMSACWEELQQLPRAIWHMERAFEVDPNNRALQDELKRLMERNRETPPARLTPSRAALARIYYNGKLYEQAINELQGALPQAPDRYDLQVLYAQALWNAEHVTEATEQALLVLETLPDSLYANRIMTELWLRASRPSDAKPYFIKVEQLDPFVAWDMLHEDGEAVPLDAFKLPRLQWDVRAAAALATGTPDWMANIGEVFVDPEAVDLSIPSEKRKRVWLDDFGAPASGQAAPTDKPRTGRLIDKYTAQPEPPPPLQADDAPSWFKEFEKEDKDSKKKRSTSVSAAIPVWGDEAPDKSSTPALSVNVPDKSSTTSADADWLFDGSDQMPPIPPEEPGESLEVRAADALAWLQNDSDELGTANATADADWLFGDEDTAAAPQANTEMPDTFDWLLEKPASTPKLNKLPTGDLPPADNSEDALSWLQTGSLSPDKLPPIELEPNNTLPTADSAVINDANDALSWLQTGNLTSDTVLAEANVMPNMDWLLDEGSVPPIDQQPAPEEESTNMFLEESAQFVDDQPETRKVTAPTQPESQSIAPPAEPPTTWATSESGESDAFAAWLDANPAPTAKASDDDQAWISELQFSDAIEADALKDAPVDAAPPTPITPPSASATPVEATPITPDAEVDEFALMFDNIDVDAALNNMNTLTPPTATEDEEHPMAWMMDLGLNLPAQEATSDNDLMDDFQPLEQAEQDPLAWMREAGLEPPPELTLDALDGEAPVEDQPSTDELTDEDAFMASLNADLTAGLETGLDIQSDLFAPQQAVQTTPEPVKPSEPEAAPEPAPLLDLSDPDWLNDFNPIQVPDDLVLPKTGSLSSSAVSEGLDWLTAFGAPETTEALTSSNVTSSQSEEASVDVSWLNESDADRLTAMGSAAFAMPESKPNIEVPAEPPKVAAEAPKIEAAADDWLASFGVIDSDIPLSTPTASEEPMLQASDDMFSLDALLGDTPLVPTSEVPDAPASVEEVKSDWLSSFGFDLGAGDDVSGNDQTFDASKAIQAAPGIPVDETPETPDWLTDMVPLDLPASADVASSAEDFSGFLNAFTDETEAPTPQAPIASTEALVGDNADWLSMFGSDESPVAAVDANVPPTVAHDDLDSLLDSFTSEPSAVSAPVIEPEPASSLDLGGGDLDWLSGLAIGDTEVTPAASAQAPAASNDVMMPSAASELDFGSFLDDLADIGGTTPATPTAAAQQPAASDDISDWLSDIGTSSPAMQGLDALDFSNLPTAEPDAAAPDLSALMADLGVQPNSLPSVQMDNDDVGLAPAALPDWMSSIAPPSELDEQITPSDAALKRSTTPMDAVNPQSIEPPSQGPSSTGFTDLLRDLKAGARPISPPTGMLPPIEQSASPAPEVQPAGESDWLAAFVEPQFEAASEVVPIDSVGTTSDDDFKLELDAILAPGDETDEAEDDVITSTASFDIDSVSDLDLGLRTTELPAAEPSNEDWLSSLGFTDEQPTMDEAVQAESPISDTQTFETPTANVEPTIEQLDDNWFDAMMTSGDTSQTTEQTPEVTEPTMSSSMFARVNQLKPENEPTSVPVDADAPDWLREMSDVTPSAQETDQVYNAKTVAPTPDSGNTSNHDNKPKTGFLLPKRAPRWSRSGKTGDLDPNVLNQPRLTQPMPVVPPEVKPEVPPEKKPANAPDDDLSNLLNSLLDDSDNDLSDLLK